MRVSSNELFSTLIIAMAEILHTQFNFVYFIRPAYHRKLAASENYEIVQVFVTPTVLYEILLRSKVRNC